NPWLISSPMPTRSDLQRVFSEQARFAAGYSPLYARLFAIVGRWLSGEAADPVVDWLLAAAFPRKAFDVTLLLMAAVHREILSGAAEARALADFYPTAGGRLPDDADEPALAAALRDLILERDDALAGFIGRADVQTNETGRGLVWLLPVVALGWPAVHLVELG